MPIKITDIDRVAVARASEQAMKEENAGLMLYIKKLESEAIKGDSKTHDKIVWINSRFRRQFRES